MVVVARVAYIWKKKFQKVKMFDSFPNQGDGLHY